MAGQQQLSVPAPAHLMLRHIRRCLHRRRGLRLHEPGLGVLLIGPQVQEQLQQAGCDVSEAPMLAAHLEGSAGTAQMAHRAAGGTIQPPSSPHLGSLVREVWVPTELPPLLHIAVRHLRQGRRRRRRRGGWQRGAWRRPNDFLRLAGFPPQQGAKRARTSILRALGQRPPPLAP